MNGIDFASRRDFMRTLLAACACSSFHGSARGQGLPKDNDFQASMSHLYLRENGQLRQILLVDAPAAEAGAMLETSIGRNSERVVLGSVQKIGRQYYIPIAPVEQESTARLALNTGGKKREISLEVRPTRRWEIYLVHNSHQDPGYLDVPSKVRALFIPFIDEAMQYCQETDGYPEDARFKWNIEVSYLIGDYRKARGEAKVREAMEWVKKGRMTIGGFYCNAATDFMSTETLHRFVYNSTSILTNEYGINLEGALLDDVPGFTWGLVEVMAKSGLRYLAWGPNGWRNNMQGDDPPILFYLEGPDGSQILVWRSATYVEGFDLIPTYIDPYMGSTIKGTNTQDGEHAIAPHLDRYDRNDYPFDVILLQVASDFNPPQKSLSEGVKTWNSLWAYPHLRMSTIPEFFHYVEHNHKQEIPRFRGGAPDGWVDQHVGESRAAALARRTEDALPDVERLATLAQLVAGGPSRQHEFQDAYHELTMWEEHTIEWDNSRVHRADIYVDESQGGGKRHWVEKTAHVSFAHEAADRIEKDTLAALCGRTPCPGPVNLIVWNPLSWARTDVVRTPLPASFPGPFRLLDTETGRQVPYQVDGASLLFLAERVPALGYRVYTAEKGEPLKSQASATVSGDSLQNRFYKLDLRRKDGAVQSLVDKELQREFVDNEQEFGFNALVYRVNRRVDLKDWVDAEEYETLGVLPVEQVSIQPGATGPVYSSIKVSGRIGYLLEFDHEIILYSDLKRIEFRNQIHRRPSYTYESVFHAFPFKLPSDSEEFMDTTNRVSNYKLDVPAAIFRPDRDQIRGSYRETYVSQHWVSVSRRDAGVYWSSADAPLVQLGRIMADENPRELVTQYNNRLRSGGLYAYLMNNHPTVDVPVAQGGDYLFRYAVSTHGPEWTYNDAHHFGWSFMSPLRVYVVEAAQKGSWPEPSRAFLEMNPENVYLAGFKAAEDGNGVILRLYEGAGLETNAAVKFNLPGQKLQSAVSCDGRERNGVSLQTEGERILLSLKSFEVSTVRVTFASKVG